VFQFQIGDADVGLVPVKFSDTDIVQHHILDGLLRLYTSPNYIKMYSLPKDFEDLKNHKLIIYRMEDSTLFKTHNILPVDYGSDNLYRSHVEVNSGAAMRSALLKGVGIGAFIYERTTVENKLLIDVFPDRPDQKIPYYFTYHKSLEGSPKVQVFHEFLKGIRKVWERP